MFRADHIKSKNGEQSSSLCSALKELGALEVVTKIEDS
jgi:hypothetical protein